MILIVGGRSGRRRHSALLLALSYARSSKLIRGNSWGRSSVPEATVRVRGRSTRPVPPREKLIGNGSQPRLTSGYYRQYCARKVGRIVPAAFCRNSSVAVLNDGYSAVMCSGVAEHGWSIPLTPLMDSSLQPPERRLSSTAITGYWFPLGTNRIHFDKMVNKAEGEAGAEGRKKMGMRGEGRRGMETTKEAHVQFVHVVARLPEIGQFSFGRGVGLAGCQQLFHRCNGTVGERT